MSESDSRYCENCFYESKELDEYPCIICDENNNEWKCKDENLITAPDHYTSGSIECIDAIRSALTEEEFRGYCKGNVLKYIWRERMKGGNEDLKKARQYIEFMEVK